MIPRALSGTPVAARGRERALQGTEVSRKGPRKSVLRRRESVLGSGFIPQAFPTIFNLAVPGAM